MTPLMCLAAAVFFESRSEPLEGQRAVAEVVMTRVESPRWPDEICAVVFQRKQFSLPTMENLMTTVSTTATSSTDKPLI